MNADQLSHLSEEESRPTSPPAQPLRWLQPVTRMLWWVLAFGLAIFALGRALQAVAAASVQYQGVLFDWSRSTRSGRLVWRFIQQAAPRFLLRMGMTMGLALLLAFAIAFLMEQRGRGRLPAWFPRLVIILLATVPTFFALTYTSGFLPALGVAPLPALLTARAMAGAMHSKDGTDWRAGLLAGLEALALQTGGIVSLLTLLEQVKVDGFWAMALNALLNFDPPVLLGVFVFYAVLILLGRLAGALLALLRARYLPQPELGARPHLPAYGRGWMTFSLVLLAIPLVVIAGGIVADPFDVSALRLVLREEVNPFLRFGFWIAVLTILGGASGALIGLMKTQRGFGTDFAANLLLLPFNALLFVPIVPGIAALERLMISQAWIRIDVITWAVVLLLLPRAVRLYVALWTSASLHENARRLRAIGLGVMLLGSAFVLFWLVTTVVPSVRLLLQRFVTMANAGDVGVWASIVAFWGCCTAFFAAADALASLFPTEEALLWLNE